MQIKAIAFAAGLAAVPALAQDISQIPQCALGPALAAISSTGCKTTDFACICKDSAFLQALEPQVQAACSPSDLQKALQFAQSTCASVGVTLTLPSVGATGGTGISSAPSTAPASTSAATSAASSSASITLGPGPVVTPSSNISTVSSIATANATVTFSSSAPTGSGAGGASGSVSGPAASGSAVSTAGAAIGMAVQGGAGILVGAMGWLLAL